MRAELVSYARECVEGHDAIRSGGAYGCCLHIVLEDFNFDRHWIESCLEEARREHHFDCVQVALALLDLDHDEMHTATGLPLSEECSMCHQSEEAT